MSFVKAVETQSHCMQPGNLVSLWNLTSVLLNPSRPCFQDIVIRAACILFRLEAMRVVSVGLAAD
eukprot:6445803-Amphidinium_carterae.1